MNKHFFKNIRDNLPEPLKFLVAPLFRNKLLNHKNFKRYYQFLATNQNLDIDDVKAYQLDRLKMILAYSYQNVPYYTDLFRNVGFNPNDLKSFQDIEGIPFLTKEMIKLNFDRLTSKKRVRGGYYIASTGGSTGEPLKVLLDYDSIFTENAFLYFFRKKLGYEFRDKVATFRGVEFGDKLWKYNPMHNEMFFSPFKLSNGTIHKYVEGILRFRPQFLNGYLSCIYFLAKLLLENRIEIKLRLKGIFLISENIDQDQRQFVEDFFNVKSMTFYGHSERCIIAQEEGRSLYKVSPFYGYTEFIKDVNGFEMVGTGFLNYTMPLIRYKTGDICQKHDDLITIRGRWNTEDYLVGLDDERVSHSAFNFHSLSFGNVINYQFVQKEKGRADLLLLVNKDFMSEEVEAMRTEIENRTKGVIHFNIKVVDSLKLSPRGKFKRFVVNNNIK